LTALVASCSLISSLKEFPDAEAPRDGQADADTSCELDATTLCYTGPPATENVGVCHGGIQTCDATGTWGSCEGELTPELQCLGRECGPDDCGGSCGDCEFGVDCADATGICLRDEMVLVVGGSFYIGSPAIEPGNGPDEPATEISVNDFQIDRTEVTNQAYLQCVTDQSACEPPITCSSGIPVWTGPISFPGDMAHHPVACISWQMAQNYCAWAGKRLCTEAEWERACVNTVHRVYPWGDTWPMNPDDYVNCNEGWCFDGVEDTAAVGSFPDGATPETGLVDMAGNVSEWVLDYYDPLYYGSVVDNPQGPCDGESPCGGLSARVHRGGSFYTEKNFLRCSKRGQQSQESRQPTTGIRCCKDYLP
jgi:formylglycine-generating enzyme required for sulfatase activity